MGAPLEELVAELVKGTIALFVIVDPLGNVPVFLSLTRGYDEPTRRRAFSTAILTGFLLLLVFAILGNEILRIFGISISSFKVAGGALLFILAMKILIYGEWKEGEASPEASGAVPLGFPLLAGPGAITSTMVTLQAAGPMVAMLSILIVSLATWVILRFIDAIHAFLGEVGSAVVSRVMAVLIAAIAVQFMIEGLLFYLSS